MRKILFKLLVFALIPIIVNAVWVAISPINLFTFRPWEALGVYWTPTSSGPFYPDQQLTMTETGYMGHGTIYAVPKLVTFITDQYGYRYGHPPVKKYNVVIIGDSMTAGVGLTQDATLFEVLAGQLQKTVYPLAPATLSKFVNDDRFVATPPDVVVMESVEGDVTPSLCSADQLAKPHWWQSLRDNYPIALHPIFTFIDRNLRMPIYFSNFVRSRLSTPEVIVNQNGMMFYAPYLNVPTLSQIDAIVSALKDCDSWMRQRGIKFIFLPVPVKENVYQDQIPQGIVLDGSPPRDLFLRRLIANLQKEGVNVVDTLSAFEQARNEGLYQLDDTHWNNRGVQIAATLIADSLAQGDFH